MTGAQGFHTGYCGTCPCGKRRFDTKTNAKKASRRQGGGMSAYRCEISGDWHIGHLAPIVKDGRISRDEFRTWRSS